MNGRARIGELLSRIVPLSGHDVEEILQEQSGNGKKFGEIALAWGLCEPRHVWEAWCQQASQEQQVIDLNRVGIDARAVALLNAEVARKLQVLPVRCAADVALIAIAAAASEQVVNELRESLRKDIKFVRADAGQLNSLLDRYYPVAA